MTQLQENSRMYMPCASLKVMADSPNLAHWTIISKAIQTTQKEKSNISEKETEDELSAIALARRTL